MITTVLANPLPRITLPSKLPNGSTVLLWLGPAGNGIPISRKTGLAVQSVLQTGASAGVQGKGCKVYLEVVSVNGRVGIGLNSGETGLATFPGNYIFETDYNDQPTWGVAFPASYFINDPYFKFANFGILTLLASASNESWCTDGYATKQENGNIALNLNQAAGNSRLIWKNPWAASNAVIVDIDVLSLPIGGELAVIGAGGSAALVITSPGSYRVEVTVDAGENLVITNNTQVQGSALITKFMARRTTQTWVCEGNLSATVNVLWGAVTAYFTRLAIQPSTAFAVTKFDKPNMYGFSPIPGKPLLGYGSMPPPSGLFRVGDTVRNNNAVAGSVSGWRCIAAGNPGTWMPLATL